MGRKLAFYGFVLIGTFIAVSYATGAGRLISSTASGGSQLIKTLQGRG